MQPCPQGNRDGCLQEAIAIMVYEIGLKALALRGLTHTRLMTGVAFCLLLTGLIAPHCQR